MTTNRTTEIDRVIAHETEVIVATHAPSDPSFSIRILGDHLHVHTAAEFLITAEELAEIRAILAARTR